jgi:hypothetical protein
VATQDFFLILSVVVVDCYNIYSDVIFALIISSSEILLPPPSLLNLRKELFSSLKSLISKGLENHGKGATGAKES